MTSLRARIAKLVAILLILQAMVAPSLCLAHAAAMLAASNGHSVEICGPEGLRSIQVTEDGQKQSPDLAAQGGFCLACHALPQALTPPEPMLAQPGWVMVAIAAPVRSLASLRPAIRGPPLGAQAPPQLS
ncbi:DUF2946 family protein [Plastoroseomonas hellenica]|uniref:DUF2946 family protein n=1 Tax=Plastoroseomonas hellenica TaxID=2687306 RepID=UPI001BACF03F|nr:DUF2946 family protein [Plastoroseomonas hellenica]MBR0645530.1 hypothetical protein [Plastoroseomonas hellenica]